MTNLFFPTKKKKKIGIDPESNKAIGNYFLIQDPKSSTIGNLHHRPYMLRDNSPVTPREEM